MVSLSILLKTVSLSNGLSNHLEPISKNIFLLTPLRRVNIMCYARKIILEISNICPAKAGLIFFACLDLSSTPSMSRGNKNLIFEIASILNIRISGLPRISLRSFSEKNVKCQMFVKAFFG